MTERRITISNLLFILPHEPLQVAAGFIHFQNIEGGKKKKKIKARIAGQMRMELERRVPQTRAAPLAIEVQGPTSFQVHNHVLAFQPYVK